SDPLGSAIRDAQQERILLDEQINQTETSSGLDMTVNAYDPIETLNLGIVYSDGNAPVTTSYSVTNPVNYLASNGAHNLQKIQVNDQKEDSKGADTYRLDARNAPKSVALAQERMRVAESLNPLNPLNANKRSALSFTAQLQKDVGRLPVTSAAERIPS
ncbi:MAG: hypothetical protein RIR79_2266, partial [Pseudomonadota bacterium]